MYFNTHSYHSLRFGTLSIDQLLEEAEKQGLSSLALTDINTTMAIPEFVKKSKERGIRPIAGMEVRNADELLFIGLARNREGFRELNEYLSWHNLNKQAYSLESTTFKHVLMIYPFEKKKAEDLSAHEFAAIRPQQVNTGW